MAAPVRAVTAQDDAVDGELTALITKIVLALPLDRYWVFCECLLEASVWVHQGRLAKRDMVDRFMQAAEAYGLVTDYGVDGIQNVLAITLREAAASVETALTNGRDTVDEATEPWPDATGTNGTNGTGHGEDISSTEAAANAWEHPDLSYLGTGRSTPPPFPLEVLGEVWGPWCSKYAMARNAPVDYVAGALLAVTGALIGNKRWPYAGGEWGEPPILWVGLVGAPGSGKSPAQDPALDLVRKLERDAAQEMAAEVASYKEKLVVAKAAHKKWEQDVEKAVKNDEQSPAKPTEAIEPKEPVVPRLIISDTTPEKIGPLLQKHPSGLLLHRDELAGWIGSFNRYSGGGENGERQLWTEAYGGRAYNIDRVKLSEPIFIPHLTVGVLGSIQPDRLPVMTGGADDGFASRFLWAWPDPVGGFKLNREPIDSSKQIDAYRHLFRLELPAQDQGGRDPGRIELSGEAAHHFESFVQDVKERAARGIGLFAGALSKAPGHVLRLAMVIEFLANPTSSEPKNICSESMLKAIDLVRDYFLPMAQRVFNEAAIPLEEQRAMTLIRWLRDHDMRELNAREGRRTIGGILREPAHMNAACKTLEKAGLIRPVFSRAGKSKGRQRKDYEVNPVVFAGTHEPSSPTTVPIVSLVPLDDQVPSTNEFAHQ